MKKLNKQILSINKPFFVASGIVILILLLPIILVLSQKEQTMQQHGQTGVNGLLVCGTNLTLQDANDQFLTSAQTRTLMQQIHVTLIRMPIRGVGGPSPWEIQAMQDIKAMGAIPMIVLKYSQPDPAGAAKLVIQQAINIFGNSTVYYEFGNERDLNGVNQTQYTQTWNQIIPQLQSLSSGSQFGGPVNYQANASYVSYFVHNANPKPSFISWHEYTCGNGADPQTVCIAHIANWANHILQTKNAITANGDTVPPIFITEWNYDPNNPSPDSRATPQFQTQFTQTALQELARDGVTGAAHYVATGHTEYNLVDTSGNLTTEGQTFGQVCGQLHGGAPLLSITPTLPMVCGGSTNNICLSGTPTPGLSIPATSGIPTSTPSPSRMNPTDTPAPTASTPSANRDPSGDFLKNLLDQLLKLIQQLLDLFKSFFSDGNDKD